MFQYPAKISIDNSPSNILYDASATNNFDLGPGFLRQPGLAENRFESSETSQKFSKNDNSKLQTTPQSQSGRRRDYTGEEKTLFEQWITSNPKPTKHQKSAYAREQCLTSSQVQNLINNSRRRAKRRIAVTTTESGGQGLQPLQTRQLSQDQILSSLPTCELSDKMNGEGRFTRPS